MVFSFCKGLKLQITTNNDMVLELICIYINITLLAKTKQITKVTSPEYYLILVRSTSQKLSHLLL